MYCLVYCALSQNNMESASVDTEIEAGSGLSKQ